MTLLKYTFILLFTILSLNFFGQSLTKKVGDIEVKLIRHNYTRNSDFKLSKKSTNRLNRPYLKLYYDSSGNILKSIGFGKHHKPNLRLVDYIKIFSYENGNLKESIEYKSDYCKNIYPYWKTKYIYNTKGELIDDSSYYYRNDSLSFKTTFEYDTNSNRIKTIFNPTYYYQRDFDSSNRIISLKQIYDDKISSEWKYYYSENKRVGNFQTFYNDGKDYSKEEIEIYNDKKLLIEKVDKYISEIGLNTKTIIHYDERGIVKRIEYFILHLDKKEYSLESYIDVKIKSKVDIDFSKALKINKQIYK